MLQRALLEAQAQVVLGQAEVDAGTLGDVDGGGEVRHVGMVPV